MAAILEKFVDADQWEAEGIVGRLGIVVHAAFLFVGFQPYGARPPPGHLLLRRSGQAGSLCLSRWYTAPQLARREGADAAALLVRARGSDVALLMFLTASGDWRGAYLERLDAATVTPLLSRALADAEPWASRVCWALAGGACWGLFAELCRRNGLALTGFMSLTDDIKVEILKRLASADDLARVEHTCRDLRRLVAERDGELRKPMYEAVRAQRRRRRRGGRWAGGGFRSSSAPRARTLSPRRWSCSAGRRSSWRPDRVSGTRSGAGRSPAPFLHFHRATARSCHRAYWTGCWIRRRETVSTRGESTAGRRRKVPRTRNVDRKKWHGAGAGAIYSPSSRYRWKHR
ncbi:hypothetical protein C2845_PM07G15710 [Panicum miliaceum]|uniref:F-box domain-containing protein n=1 Tax=Panicum miliaceum TaxID=4540 RepID=A0A3L6SSK4_PANMI|nr:hypothetical protein C2845_PM07G15710 [Panicum miliaceum]